MSQQHEDISKLLQSAPSFSKRQKKGQSENKTNVFDTPKDLSNSKLVDEVEILFIYNDFDRYLID
jgi:hypothetical protein